MNTSESGQWSRILDKYWVRDRAFYKKVLVILIPIVLQSVINQGVNMMDTIMVAGFPAEKRQVDP